MIDRGRRNLLGIAISAIDYEYAVDKIIEDAKAGRRCATTALAVHGVITGALDRAHRYRLNTFDLVTPDGQPVRWALNLLYGTKLNDRVYGPTMTLKVCKEAALQGIPVYFYGSSQQVLDKLVCAFAGDVPRFEDRGSASFGVPEVVSGRAEAGGGSDTRIRERRLFLSAWVARDRRSSLTR